LEGVTKGQAAHPAGRNPFLAATEEGSMANPEDMYQCQVTNCGCIYNPDRGDKRK
jgi:hypothetical protein